MTKTVEDLIQARTSIKSAKTRFANFVYQYNGTSAIPLKVRLSTDRHLLDKYNAIQTEIEVLTKREDTEDRENFERDYFAAIVQAEEKLADLIERTQNQNVNSGASSSHNHSESVPHNSKVQLPTINLPEFTGLYTEWTTFYESFKAIIHDNNSLADIQKFHYLKGCLSKEAQRTIDSLVVCNENYGEAWTLLKARYENKRLIVQHHIAELFDISSIAKGSASSMRAVLDNVNAHLSSLKSQGVPTDQWDLIIIHFIVSKLDIDTKTQWEATLKATELPNLNQLKAFLINKCQVLESIDCSNEGHEKFKLKPEFKINQNAAYNSNTPQCVFCRKKSHYINQCSDFLALTIAVRSQQVKKLRLCFNCLRPGHDTRSCKSTSTCKSCQGKHHTLLHFQKENRVNVAHFEPTDTVVSEKNQEVLLSTAIINVLGKSGSYFQARALLDVGAQQNFMTEALTKKLGICCSTINMPICGINEVKTVVKESAQVKFKSNVTSYSNTLTCLVIPKITNDLPLQSFHSTDLNFPNNIKRADPKFSESGPVDILIGAQLFWDLLDVGRIKLPNNETYIQNTHLGWVVGGPYSIAAIEANSNFMCHLSSSQLLEKQINKFWEIHDYSEKLLTKEDEFCETQFETTHKRSTEGRFIVKLPFRINNPHLSSTKDIAIKRFYSLENKFKKNTAFKTQYCKFMNDFIKLGHMELSQVQNLRDYEGYFLPHHGVLKPSSLTTPVRAVFDASCCTDGISLNNSLLPGPNLQKDIFQLLVRCRQYQFVLSADIEKMFRQILVAEEDRKYQTILWRESPSDVLKIYTLNTVCFGMTSSPFLAMRCLHQLAYEARDEAPEASNAILKHFFMDDLLTGANTKTDAIRLKNQIITILRKGCFELSKWASNERDVLLTENVKSNTTQAIRHKCGNKNAGVSLGL